MNGKKTKLTTKHSGIAGDIEYITKQTVENVKDVIHGVGDVIGIKRKKKNKENEDE